MTGQPAPEAAPVAVGPPYRYGAASEIFNGPDGKAWVAVHMDVQMPPGFPMARTIISFPVGVAPELLKIALAEAEKADATARQMNAAGGTALLVPRTGGLLIPGS